MFRKITAVLVILALLVVSGGCAKKPEPTEPQVTVTTVPPSGSAGPTEPEKTEPTEPEKTEPTDPEPTETDPLETEPTDPLPTETAPTDPIPTDPVPTDPIPTEPEPTEPAPTEPTQPEPELQIISLEMVQKYGDCTIIKYGDYEIMVDGGEKGDADNVRKFLNTYVTDGILELLIVTHPHSDHVGGIGQQSVFSGIDSIDMIVDSGDYNSATTQVWKNYKTNVVDYYVALGAEYYTIAQLMGEPELVTLEIADRLELTFLDSQYYYNPNSEPNNNSIGFYVQYYNTYLCMFGDAEEKAEKSFMDRNGKFTTSADTVIYKASHHGSSGANMEAFLSWLEPDYVFISSAITGTGGNAPNLTQHPHYASVLRMTAHTKEIYWNGINGTLHMDTDGELVAIYGEGRTKTYTGGDNQAEKHLTYLESQWYLTGVRDKGWIDFR